MFMYVADELVNCIAAYISLVNCESLLKENIRFLDEITRDLPQEQRPEYLWAFDYTISDGRCKEPLRLFGTASVVY